MNETGDAVPLQKPLRYHVGGPMFKRHIKAYRRERI